MTESQKLVENVCWAATSNEGLFGINGLWETQLVRPPAARKAVYLVNMTRCLETLSPRLQGNKRALLICSQREQADSTWTCGRSRWQLGTALTPYACTLTVQHIQNFWRIAALIDENNTIILEELRETYWIQIMQMSVAVLGSKVSELADVCTVTIILFHERRIAWLVPT